MVSPDRVAIDVPLDAGERFFCTITIRNRHPASVTFELQVRGLRGSRSRGGVEFVVADDPAASSTAAGWLTPSPARVTLPPRGVAKVPVAVKVPRDAPVGGSYAAIEVVPVRTLELPGETNVGVVTSVAVPFLLTVGGRGEPRLRLRDVRAPTLRWERDPWTLRARLDNDGTLHATPSGAVRVRSLFGNVVAELPVAGSPLLPGGRQPVEVTWDRVPWFGIYRHELRIASTSPEHRGEVARARGWLVALPPWWVLLAAAALVVATILLRRHRRHAPAPDDEAHPDHWNA